MKNGGYKIIDLKDRSLSDEAVVIAGIYESIEDSHRKPLLLSGIVLDDVEKNDVFVEASVNDGSYVISVYGGTITINDDDEVVFTVA